MKKLIICIPTGVFSLVVTLLLCYMSLASNPFEARSLTLFPGADKCVHFLMYFGCTAVYLFEYVKRKIPHHTSLNIELAITSSAALMGLFLEMAQLFLITDRGFEWWDCVANASGAFVAFIAMRFLGGAHFIRHSLYHAVTKRKRKIRRERYYTQRSKH